MSDRKVTYDIKVDVSVKIIDSKDKIDNKTPLLAIVDDLGFSSNGAKELDVAQKPGRVALLEENDLANPSRKDFGLKNALHEVLHLFGANHHSVMLGANEVFKSDKDVMNYEPNTSYELHDEHKMKVWVRPFSGIKFGKRLLKKAI
ncbi:hypothetical protein [Deminuibacter soli]|uniref:Uncharacterized protein n=1 Tax=Deminuibacter soli TaxID=2291815 RepID=A0A3E1NJ36_9BACT|nr:hypothetical protein [Deminuibacter soli]RFM27943.1 hypothetical protein DXN05_10370 [Deminuibacter soli]